MTENQSEGSGATAPRTTLLAGDALDLIQQEHGHFALIATDPPYAFGGSGDEHAISATVAVVLREAARRLERGRWMLVMCASSWRSQSYMVESVRGIVEPVRTGTWCKPKARTKVKGSGWEWASVKVIAFRKGKAIDQRGVEMLDHITAEPVMNGRRAELPPAVAHWMVAPFAAQGRFLDPFAGSGAIVNAAAALGMVALGYEKNRSATRQDADTRDPPAALPTSGVAPVAPTTGRPISEQPRAAPPKETP